MADRLDDKGLETIFGGSGFVGRYAVAALAKRLAHTAPARPLSETLMPGPTGELNRLTVHPRAAILCLGPGEDAEIRQANAVEALGGCAVRAGGRLDPAALSGSKDFSCVIYWGGTEEARAFEQALARRDGPIVPLVTSLPDAGRVLLERHLCVDTTAAGGNAALLAGGERKGRCPLLACGKFSPGILGARRRTWRASAHSSSCFKYPGVRGRAPV